VGRDIKRGESPSREEPWEEKGRGIIKTGGRGVVFWVKPFTRERGLGKSCMEKGRGGGTGWFRREAKRNGRLKTIYIHLTPRKDRKMGGKMCHGGEGKIFTKK